MHTSTQYRLNPRRRGQVLIILLGALFLGGSAAAIGGTFFTGRSVTQIDKALKKAIDDGPRRKTARKLVERWGEDAEKFLERTEKRKRSLLKSLQRHETSRESLDASLAEQEADLELITKKILDHRFALRAKLTTEEWAEVFPRQ